MKIGLRLIPCIALVLLALGGVAVCMRARTAKGEGRLTEAETRAVIQAVEDEIYDYGFEGDYDRAGENVAGASAKCVSRMPVYIAPEIEDEGGEIIYRLMPYGEVYRLFTIRKDGLAILEGDPQLGFPPTQPSRKTQYMDSEKVRQMKRDWLKRDFEVDTSPSLPVVRESAHRQKLRTGYSYWESVILPHLKPAASRPVTDAEEKAIVQAVEDEIYDEGCQGYGADAASVQGNGWYQLRMYVSPDVDREKGKDAGTAGEIIYKFPPIGEVIRTFSIEPGGMAILYGHPQWDFPPTSPNFLTVYMDDDELCRYKRDWPRVNYRLELKPSKETLREAEARQKARFGEAYAQHKRDCSFSWR